MKQIILTFSALLLVPMLWAQSPDAARAAQEFKKQQQRQQAEENIEISLASTSLASTITAADMKSHLSVLASDEFEGRETGSPGNEKAAEYIAEQFRQMDLPPIGDNQSYFQDVVFTWSMWNELDMNINGQNFTHKKDYISFPTRNSHQERIETDEILFLGYGIDDKKYSDYKGANVRDKVLLIYKGEPITKNGLSRITGTPDLSEWSTDWTKKLRVAHDKGAKMVLIIDHEIQKQMVESIKFLIGPQITLGRDADPKGQFANNAIISTNVAKAIIGKKFKKVVKARKKIQKRGKAKRVKLDCQFAMVQKKDQRQLVGNNVLGYIEGTDEKLKEELVVVSAHYDHLGKQGESIYNGADDNGSGTTTAIEIAEAFVEAKRRGEGPRRSILVMLVTGEEKGLLGSQYYTEKPIFPLENTVADVNIDMVGRIDQKYELAGNPNYIYVIGSNRLSTELHNINEAANEKFTQLTLDYTYNAKDDPNRYYYRSDHYNFAEKGIPAIFYFNGTHKDYHRTSDTVEKINFEKMEKIGRLIFHTTWELANRDKRIEVDVTEK